MQDGTVHELPDIRQADEVTFDPNKALEPNLPPVVDRAKHKLLFLSDAQDTYGMDKGEEVTDEFIADVVSCIYPSLYWYLIAPVGIVRKSIGGIIMPDTAVSNQKWTHGTGVVLAHGPAVYRGRTFAEMGITPEHAPQVGHIVTYDPKAPKRFNFEHRGIKREVICVPDHALFTTLKPEAMDRVSFAFGY